VGDCVETDQYSVSPASPMSRCSPFRRSRPK
jgi:hypothetical protein